MKKASILLIIWIIFNGLAFTQNSFAAPLKFIKGFKVTVEEEFIPDTIIQSGLNISKLKIRIEEKLKKAGIKVYISDSTEYYKSGRPHLNLSITGDRVSKSQIFCVIDLEIIQTVRLWEFPDEIVRASFGISRYIGKISEIIELNKIIENQIEKFIKSYLD